MTKTKAQSAAKTSSLPKSSGKAPVEGINPKQHKIEVLMTDGSRFDILTTWGKEGDVLRLDLDPKNHPAWQEKGQSFVNVNDERVAEFKRKFGNFDFVGK